MATRTWHPNFTKYVESIVNHKNYRGLFFERSKDGQVKWVVTGKSKDGQKRKAWWDEKCKELRIKLVPGCYAIAARAIHPTKFHTCQICGRELNVEYVYPNKRLLSKLKSGFGKTVEPYTLTVFELIDRFVKEDVDLKKFAELLNLESDQFRKIEDLKAYVSREMVEKSNKGFLTPGAMCNPPDRFDGFHTDCNICRPSSDKGRHKANLKRYGQDRRAYEFWSDGDWKKADRLMSQFREHGVSADHIGPISLGFCHRPKFQPLTGGANSAKGNRMRFSDVRSLLTDERRGSCVVSWHSKYIWDLLKNKVKSDEDALRLSKLMKKNLHWVMMLFAIIDENGGRDFLAQFLHPEYSFFDHRFIGFNPVDGSYKKVKTIKRSGQNQTNNANRMYRKAFKALDDYKKKTNRWHKIWKDEVIDAEIEKLVGLASDNKNNVRARLLLRRILKSFAAKLAVLW